MSARWRKASASINAGTCVQVAVNLPGVAAVRDSEGPPGPALTFTPAAWHGFSARVCRWTWPPAANAGLARRAGRPGTGPDSAPFIRELPRRYLHALSSPGDFQPWE